MTTHSKVAELLHDKPELRNSDKKLLLEFWESEGLILSFSQRAAFMQCTPAESITRQRRLLKEQYPAAKEVEEKRYEQYEMFKHNVGMA